MITLDEYLQIRDLIHQGLSRREIARRTGLDRKTIRKYLNPVTGPPQSKSRQRSSLLDGFKDYLRKRLSQGCTNAEILFREIKEQGYQGHITILRDFLHPLRREEKWRVELRWESAPGQYAQVDWGQCQALLPDGSTAKLYVFVYTLAYSRVTYAEWTNRMDMLTLQRCHEAAFSYLGGVPEYIIYDRMKTVVKGQDEGGQATFNAAFRDFADYYGFLPRACPPYWPRGKGKVESGVKYVKGNFWQGLISITGLEDLNQRCYRWLDQIANVRIHGTTGRIPFEMLKEEKLKPVSGRPPYPTHPAVIRPVSRDCLVSYRGCCYSLPAEWAGNNVWVREISGEKIVVSAGNKIISEQPLEMVLKRTLINEAHYSSLRGRPHFSPLKVLPRMESPTEEVEHRSLSEYATLAEVG
jgi:transposase